MPKLTKKPPIRSVEERNKIVENNIKLIDKFLYDNHLSENAIPDYRGAAYVGLINAADNYNDTMGVSFSTYAYACIEREISHENVHRVMDIPEYAIVSIDKPICTDDSNSDTIKDLLSNYTENVETIVPTIDIRKIYHSLPNREREIALRKIQGYNFEEIGKTLGVTRKRIEQLYKRFKKKVEAYVYK